MHKNGEMNLPGASLFLGIICQGMFFFGPYSTLACMFIITISPSEPSQFKIAQAISAFKENIQTLNN